MTAVPLFLTFFTYYVCLFCSHIVVNIMEFYANVIQVRVLASYNTSYFLHRKMPEPIQECDNCYLFV